MSVIKDTVGVFGISIFHTHHYELYMYTRPTPFLGQNPSIFFAQTQRTLDTLIRTVPEDRFVDQHDAYLYHAAHTVDLDVSGDVFEGEGVYATRLFNTRTSRRATHCTAARAFVEHLLRDVHRAVCMFLRTLPVLESHVRVCGHAAIRLMYMAASTLQRVAIRAWDRYVAWCAPRVIEGDITASSTEECPDRSFEHDVPLPRTIAPQKSKVLYADLPRWWYAAPPTDILVDTEAIQGNEVREGMNRQYLFVRPVEEQCGNDTLVAVPRGVAYGDVSDDRSAERVSGVGKTLPPHSHEDLATHDPVSMLRVWERACISLLRTLIEGPVRTY